MPIRRLHDHPGTHGRRACRTRCGGSTTTTSGCARRTVYPAKRKIADYFRENFYLTTSGNFRSQALIDAMLEIGADRILFSADWPFENIDHASDWFDTATIAEGDRLKIGRDNACSAVQAAELNTPCQTCRRAEGASSIQRGGNREHFARDRRARGVVRRGHWPAAHRARHPRSR